MVDWNNEQQDNLLPKKQFCFRMASNINADASD